MHWACSVEDLSQINYTWAWFASATTAVWSLLFQYGHATRSSDLQYYVYRALLGPSYSREQVILHQRRLSPNGAIQVLFKCISPSRWCKFMEVCRSGVSYRRLHHILQKERRFLRMPSTCKVQNSILTECVAQWHYQIVYTTQITHLACKERLKGLIWKAFASSYTHSL